eukprot:scaffold42711_cov37-Attheya_sp.AAC.1
MPLHDGTLAFDHIIRLSQKLVGGEIEFFLALKLSDAGGAIVETDGVDGRVTGLLGQVGVDMIIFIKWDYEAHMCDYSLPDYIEQALHHFQHQTTKQPPLMNESKTVHTS